MSHPCPCHSLSHYSTLAPHSTHLSMKWSCLFTSVDMFCVSLSTPKYKVQKGRPCISQIHCYIPIVWDSTRYTGGSKYLWNECISEWMGIAVGKKILTISRVGKDACAELYFSGHSVTSGGPGKVSDFTMWQIHFSKTQPGHVDKHTDPKVQCWGHSLATYLTTSTPGLIEWPWTRSVVLPIKLK